MNITSEMLQAAMKKAIEAGLLPRNACREDLPAHQEMIRFILKAALDLAPAARSVSKQLRAGEEASPFVRRVSANCSANMSDTGYALR